MCPNCGNPDWGDIETDDTHKCSCGCYISWGMTGHHSFVGEYRDPGRPQNTLVRSEELALFD